MVKLSGILKYSMGGFLCLRGFASFKMLSDISKPLPDIQRDLIEEHKGEMAAFLNKGEYRFFPEVILSLNITDGSGFFEEVNSFHKTLQVGETWNRNIGGIGFSISQNRTKNIMNKYSPLPRVDRINIAHIKFEENEQTVLRIDGNHRLSAAEDINEDFNVPFCLLMFRNPTENGKYSRAIFHNINAKQIPLNLEQNLKVIIKGDETFSDSTLKSDPTFGWEYYLTRKTYNKIKWEKYPFIQTLIKNNEYTYFLEVFKSLINNGSLEKNEDSVDKLVSELPKIEKALQEARLSSLPQNLAVIGAISFYKLTNKEKYTAFLRWVKENCIAEAPSIHMADLIEIFDKVFENTPKNVFMSMQFSEETEDTYQTVKDVQKILKDENGIEFNLIKVDEHKDGYSDEIYHRIIDGIAQSSLVIADLSYGNKNVHHEIGYAQALGKKVLLIYKCRKGVDSKDEIGSNISMHDQLRFKNQTDLRPRLLEKIRQFYGIQD